MPCFGLPLCWPNARRCVCWSSSAGGRRQRSDEMFRSSGDCSMSRFGTMCPSWRMEAQRNGLKLGFQGITWASNQLQAFEVCSSYTRHCSCQLPAQEKQPVAKRCFGAADKVASLALLATVAGLKKPGVVKAL